MFHSKDLFIFLLIFISICSGLPTLKNDSAINKETKTNPELDTKANLENAANAKPPQINSSNLKVLNDTDKKIITQVEETSKNIQNDKIQSETIVTNGNKDSQKAPISPQNNSHISIESPLKTQHDDDTKNENPPEDKENKEKDEVELSSDKQQKIEKEKSKDQEVKTETKEISKSDKPEVSDAINQVEKEKEKIENKPQVENVTPRMQSTIKLNVDKTNKNEKNEEPEKDPLYSSDINISKEKAKGNEDTYDEYDDKTFPQNVKNNQEKENPSLNNPSGYIPNKNLGMIDDANSHFFAYLVTLMVLVVLFYLLFHNKQRIIALMIEGRGSRPSRRGSARAKYHKLDNNLEEAMGSMRSEGNAGVSNIY